MNEDNWSSEEEGEVDLPTPDAPSDSEAPSTGEPSGEQNPGPSSEVQPPRSPSHRSEVIPSAVRSDVNHQYFWHLLNQYGPTNQHDGSNEDRHIPSSEFANSHAGNDLPRFTLSFMGPPGNNTMGRAIESEALPADDDSASEIDVLEKDGSKTESDNSAKEKSDGKGEKETAAEATTAAKSDLFSSPDLSDKEISDLSDFPPDYDSLQNEQAQEIAETSLIVNSSTCRVEEVNSDLTVSADKEPSEVSNEGEAAALPVVSSAHTSGEWWGQEDQLFALNAPRPSTSSGGDRIPSPASKPNLQHARGSERQLARDRGTDVEIVRFIIVPTEKIGRIIGKGGRRIKDIEKRTGAKIKITNRKSSEPETQINLTGTDEQTSAAGEEICGIAGFKFLSLRNAGSVRVHLLQSAAVMTRNLD